MANNIKSLKSTAALVDSILVCAASFFEKHGYRKTTVDDIAGFIHISKKTIYGIFPSKESILKEFIWRDISVVTAVFNDNTDDSIQPGETLLAFCRFIFSDRLNNSKKGYFKWFYTNDPDIYLAFLNALKKIIREMYEKGMSSGAFKPVNATLASEIIVGIIVASIEHYDKTSEITGIFNDTLGILSDTVSYRSRVNYDRFA